MQTHIHFTGLSDLFRKAQHQNSDYLFEYEVYEFIRLIGGETPPQFILLDNKTRFESRMLRELPGKKVVIKVVSPTILDKSDVGGVRICGKNGDEVLSTLRRMSCGQERIVTDNQLLECFSAFISGCPPFFSDQQPQPLYY